MMRKHQADVAILRGILKRGDVVFDVGAHAGMYTSLFARYVGVNGWVHAFEPCPPIFEQLERNVRGLVHVVPNRCAVGDAQGATALFVPAGDFTQAAVRCHTAYSWKRAGDGGVEVFETCRVVTLDAYVRAAGLGPVALVKCDVEGAEMDVVKGATSLIRSASPPIWFLESFAPWTRDFGYEPGDLFALLAATGNYGIFHLGPAGLTRVLPGHGVPGVYPDFLNFLAVAPAHRERVGWLFGSHASTHI